MVEAALRTQLGDAVGPIEQGKKMLLDSKVCSCQYSIPNEGALVEAALGTKLGDAVGPIEADLKLVVGMAKGSIFYHC